MNHLRLIIVAVVLTVLIIAVVLNNSTGTKETYRSLATAGTLASVASSSVSPLSAVDGGSDRSSTVDAPPAATSVSFDFSTSPTKFELFDPSRSPLVKSREFSLPTGCSVDSATAAASGRNNHSSSSSFTGAVNPERFQIKTMCSNYKPKYDVIKKLAHTAPVCDIAAVHDVAAIRLHPQPDSFSSEADSGWSRDDIDRANHCLARERALVKQLRENLPLQEAPASAMAPVLDRVRERFQRLYYRPRRRAAAESAPRASTEDELENEAAKRATMEKIEKAKKGGGGDRGGGNGKPSSSGTTFCPAPVRIATTWVINAGGKHVQAEEGRIVLLKSFLEHAVPGVDELHVFTDHSPKLAIDMAQTLRRIIYRQRRGQELAEEEQQRKQRDGGTTQEDGINRRKQNVAAASSSSSSSSSSGAKTVAVDDWTDPAPKVASQQLFDNPGNVAEHAEKKILRDMNRLVAKIRTFDLRSWNLASAPKGYNPSGFQAPSNLRVFYFSYFVDHILPPLLAKTNRFVTSLLMFDARDVFLQGNVFDAVEQLQIPNKDRGTLTPHDYVFAVSEEMRLGENEMNKLWLHDFTGKKLLDDILTYNATHPLPPKLKRRIEKQEQLEQQQKQKKGAAAAAAAADPRKMARLIRDREKEVKQLLLQKQRGEEEEEKQQQQQGHLPPPVDKDGDSVDGKISPAAVAAMKMMAGRKNKQKTTNTEGEAVPNWKATMPSVDALNRLEDPDDDDGGGGESKWLPASRKLPTGELLPVICSGFWGASSLRAASEFLHLTSRLLDAMPGGNGADQPALQIAFYAFLQYTGFPFGVYLLSPHTTIGRHMIGRNIFDKMPRSDKRSDGTPRRWLNCNGVPWSFVHQLDRHTSAWIPIRTHAINFLMLNREKGVDNFEPWNMPGVSKRLSQAQGGGGRGNPAVLQPIGGSIFADSAGGGGGGGGKKKSKEN